MALSDILLHIDTYPEPTSEADIQQAVDFVKLLGGRVSALGLGIHIPLESNRIADYLLKLSDIIDEAEEASRQSGRERLDFFVAAAGRAGVMGEALEAKAELFDYGQHVARRALARDLSLVPLGGRYDGQLEVAQEVVFGSGRPVIVFKSGKADLPTRELGVAVVAWDGSRFAARALNEALPILAHAHEVRVLTILGEKPAARPGLSAEPVRHLRAHGIAAVGDEVDGAGERVGETIDRYLTAHRAGLLVMGAYGHSRLREFILGGATEHVLSEPKTAIFLAH